MEGSKHFQSAQLVQEMGTEEGTAVIASIYLHLRTGCGRGERKVMPDLGNSRRKLEIAIGAMLAADIVAVAVLFSPLVGSATHGGRRFWNLRPNLQKKPTRWRR